MKFGPIDEAEEALILNEGLEAAIQIIQSSLKDFSRDARLELDSVIDFIKEGKEYGKANQLWL